MTAENNNKQSGFTLVELLLAITFFSFILVFASASYIRINRSYVRGANVKLVQENARKITNEISTALREHGGAFIEIHDNDNFAECNYATQLNDVSSNYTAPPTAYANNCRHRLCVGDKRFAWNQAVIRPGMSEHSWYKYSDFLILPYYPTGPNEPFSVVKTGQNIDLTGGCLDNVAYLDSVELIDAERVMVQDIDVYQLSADTFRINVTVSTMDNDPTDNLDLAYTTAPGEENTSVNEYKARSCNTDAQSLQFCYVETLSTIVSIR